MTQKLDQYEAIFSKAIPFLVTQDHNNGPS
jgi:hypothetical protein